MKTSCWMILVVDLRVIEIKKALLIGIAFLLVGCGPAQIDLTGQTMGTSYSVKYIPNPHSPSVDQIKTDIDQRLEQVNDQMSTYRPESEVSRFNQFHVINQPVEVSSAVIKVVNEAIRIHALTEGALDITVGPLVNLWGFGPEKRTDTKPDPEELKKRQSWTGIDKLVVVPQGLMKKRPELYLDLSSIAKGYAVDVIADYLKQLQIDNYMVDIGGEVRTEGKNGKGKRWRIAIEKPLAGLEQQVEQIIEPGDNAVATSGDYRNYFEDKGKRFSHTIDPRTGYPIDHKLVSITVIHPSCMTADGLATGLNVLGPEKGMQLANQLQLAVLMIVKTDTGFEERYSAAFMPYLQKK